MGYPVKFLPLLCVNATVMTVWRLVLVNARHHTMYAETIFSKLRHQCRLPVIDHALATTVNDSTDRLPPGNRNHKRRAIHSRTESLSQAIIHWQAVIHDHYFASIGCRFLHEETRNHFHDDPLTRRWLHDHPMIATQFSSLAQETNMNWLQNHSFRCTLGHHFTIPARTQLSDSVKINLTNLRCFPS